MALEFYRQNPDTLTIQFQPNDYNTAGANLRVVFKTIDNAATVDSEDALAVLTKTVAVVGDVTEVDVPLTKADLTLDPQKYVCGAKLFLADGTLVPIELKEPNVVIKLSTVQDTTL